MELSLVPKYAAMFGIALIVLSLMVIRIRRRQRIALGDQGNDALARAIRVQGNFCEYVPLALLLLAFVEMGGAAAWLIHLLCWLLVVGRASHAFGVSRSPENFRFRVFGMMATFIVIGASASILLTGGGLLVAAVEALSGSESH